MPLLETHDVLIATDTVTLPGHLASISAARGMVVFAHGSGSSRFSARNQAVAKHLQSEGYSTLLFDLLTAEEDRDHNNRFDLDLLTARLVAATQYAGRHDDDAPIALFGASTGAAAALRVAVELESLVKAVVSRGGRPDLATEALGRVRCPTLFIVGGADTEVLALNREAQAQLPADTVSRIEVIPGASHLFEEPGAMDQVAALAAEWLHDHLGHQAPPARATG